MKQTLKNIIRNVKSINGNSLAEFATTTALMATLAATAAPKLSEMSEGTKAQKSRSEIDKIIKQGMNFYQKTADEEGRGRFPGQDRFNESVGGPGGVEYTNNDASTEGVWVDGYNNYVAHLTAIDKDLALIDGEDGNRTYHHATENGWVSVFGINNEDAPLPEGVSHILDNEVGATTWMNDCFGYESLKSPYQDGHFVYTVIAGAGSGDFHIPPILYVGDIENLVNYNNVLYP